MTTNPLLLVDDDRELSRMLAEYLAGEGFETAIAPDGLTALDRLKSSNFDLVILDVMMPGMGGFEVLRRLRQMPLQVPVIMLTARGEEVDRIVGLELGADDYLAKPFNPRELMARIRAVLRRANVRETGDPDTPLSLGSLRVDPNNFEVKVGTSPIRLTGVEFRLLHQLMQRAGVVQSRDSLSEQVLGRRLQAYDRSIDTHVSNIRRKLGCGQPGVPEIRSQRGEGYVLIQPSEAA
jgi:two-component system response regulator CpxR